MADSSFTFEEFVAAKHDTRMQAAERLLDDLLPAARARGGERVRRAAETLAAWDRSADAESRGAVLFREFMDELWSGAGSGGAYAEPWDPARPVSTPDGFRDPEAAVRALDTAAATVDSIYGRLDVRWGEAYRIHRDGVDLAASGGAGELGIFRVLWFPDRPGWGGAPEGAYRAYGGDSFAMAVEFTDPPRARALVAYGNASQPDVSGGGDQVRRFAAGELRPALVPGVLQARGLPDQLAYPRSMA